MPRTHNRTDQVICYRLLVESFYDNEWHEVLVYGPYFTKGPPKATIDGAENHYKDRYLKGTRRCKVQMQSVSNLTHDIEWVDV